MIFSRAAIAICAQRRSGGATYACGRDERRLVVVDVTELDARTGRQQELDECRVAFLRRDKERRAGAAQSVGTPARRQRRPRRTNVAKLGRLEQRVGSRTLCRHR